MLKTINMQPTQREAHLDWLRIFAIIGVLFFHSAMPFAAEEWWHIKNKETSNVLLEFNFWLSRFRMPLLFFISGAVSYYMMKNRSAASFIGLRFRRLFVPLLFGMLVIVPPQVYMERLTQGFKGSFLEFYPSIFNFEPYPNGNTSWHHLWFIAYLFVYDLVAAPLFAWMISPKGKNFARRLHWFGKHTRIYLFAIPSVVLYASLVLKYPETNDLIHDYAFLPYWFLFLLVGFLCVITPSLMESLKRNRRTSLTIGILLLIAMNYLRWNGKEPWDVLGQNWRELPQTYLYLALYPAVAWFWVMALTGYGKKYLTTSNNFSNYASQMVYPFYVVHQTIIVILAYYIVQANDDVMMKYLFLSLASLFLSVAACHLLIQRFGATRFLFGLKPMSRKISPGPRPLRSQPKNLPSKSEHETLV